MLLAGLRHHNVATAESSVVSQWREFLSLEQVPGRIDARYFGVMCGASESGFEYMTAVEVESFDGLDPEVGRMRVPAQRYAVFRPAAGTPIGTTWRGILSWLSSGPY